MRQSQPTTRNPKINNPVINHRGFRFVMVLFSLMFPGISWAQISSGDPTAGCDVSGSYFSWHDWRGGDNANPNDPTHAGTDFVHPRSRQRQGDCGICHTFALTQEAEIRYRIWWYGQTGQLPDYHFPVNFSEEAVRSYWFAFGLEHGVDNRFCDQSAGDDSDRIAMTMAEQGIPLVSESESPYPIELYLGNRLYLAQLDYEARERLLLGALPGARFTATQHVTDAQYDTINWPPWDEDFWIPRLVSSGAVASTSSIDAVKHALKCGNSQVDAGPLTSTVYFQLGAGRDLEANGIVYGEPYYFAGRFEEDSGHVVGIIGWIDRNDPGFDDAWDAMTVAAASPTGAQRLCFEPDGCPGRKNFVLPKKSDGTDYTPDELKGMVSTLFIVLDNHDTELQPDGRPLMHYLPAFSDHPDFYPLTAFLRGVSAHQLDFSTYYPANQDNENGVGDGVPEFTDNCPRELNPLQQVAGILVQPDIDGDGVGDECDPDIDGDGVFNGFDEFPLNRYIATDLNDNENYERSVKPHIILVPFGTTTRMEIPYGPGFRVVWQPDGEHLVRCQAECDRIYASNGFHPDLAPGTPVLNQCKDACTRAETFDSNTLEPWLASGNSYDDPIPSQAGPLSLLGTNTFPCMYQNYFHPHCQQWVRFLLALKKTDCENLVPTSQVWCGASQLDLTLFSQELAAILDIIFSSRWGGSFYNYPVLDSLGTLRAFFQDYFDSTNDSEEVGSSITHFLALSSHLDADAFDYVHSSLDMTVELARMNACEIVHQSQLVTFRPEWFDTQRVSGFADYQAFSTWIQARQSDCERAFTKPRLKATVSISDGVYSSALGGYSQIPGNPGFWKFGTCSSAEKKLTYGVQKERRFWDENHWDIKWEDLPEDETLRHARLGVCVCKGLKWELGECGDVCIDTGAVEDVDSVFEEDLDGIGTPQGWINQSWDPVQSSSAQALASFSTGASACDDPSTQNSVGGVAEDFCNGKDINRGSVAFHRDHAFDMDAWLRSEDQTPDSYKLMGEMSDGGTLKQIGQFKARISSHDPAHFLIRSKTESGVTRHHPLYSYIGIKGYSSETMPVYEKEGCNIGIAVRHWDPQKIRIAPVADGPLGDPIPWMFLKNPGDSGLLQILGTDGVAVQVVAEAPSTVTAASPWRSGARKTFLLAHEEGGVLRRLQFADVTPNGLTNQKPIVGLLPTVADPVWVRLGENSILLAGKKDGAIRLYAVAILEPGQLPSGVTFAVPLGRISGSSVALAKQGEALMAAVGDGTRVRLWQIQSDVPFFQRAEFAMSEPVDNVLSTGGSWVVKTSQSLIRWTPGQGTVAISTTGLQEDRSGCAVSLSQEGRTVLLCPKSADGLLPVGYTWKDGTWEVAPCYGNL